MKRFFLVLLGLLVGAVAGGVAGVLLGMIYVELFNVSCFEGACGFVVFLGFAPAGLGLGALIGAILAFLWTRQSQVARPFRPGNPT